MSEQELALTHEAPRFWVTQVVRDARAHAWVFICVSGLVFAGFVVFQLVQPTRYTSTATMEYAALGVSEQGSAPGSETSSLLMMQEFIATENYVLKSRALAERVVVKLGLYENGPSHKDRRTAVKSRSIETVAQELQSQIEVRNVPGTRVVALSVSANRPELAQKLANTYLETYIEKSIEDRVSTSSRAIEWLSEQVKTLEGELESAEGSVAQFRERTGALATSSAERHALVVEQIKELTGTLQEIRTRRVYTQAKLDVLKKGLDSTSDHVSLTIGPLAENSSLRALRDRYRALAIEIEPLVVAHGEDHPDVRTRRAAQRAVVEQVEQEIRGVVSALESELKELDVAEKSFKASLLQANNEGAALARDEFEFSRLDRARTSKSQMMQTMMERATAANLSRALHVATARIVDRASLPTTPSSPRALVVWPLGLLLAFCAGLLATYVRARLRPA